jgi:hypothetical protein
MYKSHNRYTTPAYLIPLETKSNNPTPSTIRTSMTQEFRNGKSTLSVANKRISTLSELRQRISHGLCCKREPLKACFDRAELSRKEGKDYSDLDPERAFIAFARAGYLLLVKLPMHPHYKLLLSEEQRREMLQVCRIHPYVFALPF